MNILLNNQRGEYGAYKIEFCCGRVTDTIGMPRVGRCRLTVRLKNPRKSNFRKVTLTRDVRCGGDIWRWEMVGVERQPANVFLTDDMDRLINKWFGSAMTATVWIKIEATA